MTTSNITPNSLAAAVSVGVENVRFAPIAETLPRRILLVGKYDRDITDVEDWKLKRINSADEAGSLYGFGSEIHRLAKWCFLGSQGVETWVCPDPDMGSNGTPTDAYGSINITANGVLAGTLHLYISGEYVPVRVNDDDTASDIENAIVAAINEDKTLSITASTTIPTADQVNTKSKIRSVFSNYTKISFNEDFGQEFPIGVSVIVSQPTGGSGQLFFSYVLESLGYGDEQNEKYFTDFVPSEHHTETDILDAISKWNGIDNDFVGNYAKTIQRPLRCLFGDTESGSTGYNDLINLGNSRKQDRTNGIIAVPGSPNHPQEIAALALGIAARINNRNAAEGYANEFLPSVWPGAVEDRWTSSYSNRDNAVKAGISPTIYEDGAVKMQNLVTFYHPDNMSPSSNGYRSMRAICVLQNVSNSVRSTFKQDKWQRISIVEDVTKVNDIIARQKVRDKKAIENEGIALAQAWEKLGWIYTASFTINLIKTGNYIQIRAGGTGFDVVIPIILSGEAWIIDSLIQFDTALTVFTQ